MRLIDADALVEKLQDDAEHMENEIFKLTTYAAINDINHAPTIENGWTPCSNKLPEKEGCYLITVDEYDKKYVDTDFFHFRADGTPHWYFHTNVIAWMPFPQLWEDKNG